MEGLVGFGGKGEDLTDFIVDSSGHCLLCLDRLSSEQSAGPKRSKSSLTNYSLQYLTRHLKLDLRKALINKGLLAHPQLLDKVVERSKLRVELCEDCVNLNGRCWKLVRQLEEIQREVEGCLRKIHGKLTKGEMTGEMDEFRRLTYDQIDSGSGVGVGMIRSKLRIVEAVRSEVMEGCSRQFNYVTQSKLRSLKVKSISRPPQGPSLGDPERPDLDGDDSNDAMSNPGNEDDLSDDDIGPGHDEPAEIKMEAEDAVEDFDEVDLPPSSGDDEAEADDPLGPINSSEDSDFEPGGRRSRKRKKVQKKKVIKKVGTSSSTDPQYSFVIISSADADPAGAETPRFTLDPETKRCNCNICGVELSSYHTFKRHYSNLHGQVRYKCTICQKEFRHRESYNEHHQGVHIGLRTQCDQCGTVFTRRSHMRRHLRAGTCDPNRRKGSHMRKTRIPTEPKDHTCTCDICGLGFVRHYNLLAHKREVHMQVRKYDCSKCDMKFKRRDGLNRHMTRAHFGSGGEGEGKPPPPVEASTTSTGPEAILNESGDSNG